MHLLKHTAKAVAASIMLSAAVTGCRAPATRPASIPGTESTSAAAPTVATRYRIDGAASSLHILVYRAGALARLGHNHVVSSSKVSGFVAVDPILAKSHVQIILPVASVVVDDADARRLEGEDFSAEVPLEARESTRSNLLRAEILDVARYPEISLQSVRVSGLHAAPSLVMRVKLKDVEREVTVPVQMSYGTKNLTATGEFQLKQTDFGITPFSAGLGALQVRDTLVIKFRIVARA
ncbi:MAG: YceI family protein [Candidatus Obscuribacterales bacterium]|nr:YceI family protein [Steroidobacteraceae bacterium]